MDPLKGPSLLISSCSSLHRPIGAPNTSSYIIRGKGKAYLFIAQIGRYMYIENVRWERCFLCPCWNMYSQHMSTLCTLWSLWAEHHCFWNTTCLYSKDVASRWRLWAVFRIIRIFLLLQFLQKYPKVQSWQLYTRIRYPASSEPTKVAQIEPVVSLLIRFVEYYRYIIPLAWGRESL
jgi:hypothetical protein